MSAEVLRLEKFASYGLETPRPIAEEATAGEGSTFAPSMSPPLRPSIPEAVEAGTASHLFRSGTDQHDALLVDAEKMLHVGSTVLWSGVPRLGLGKTTDSVTAGLRVVDPISRSVGMMPEKASPMEHCSEILYATSAKLPDERALHNRYMQVLHFDTVESPASFADSANVAVAEVWAAIWHTEDVECLVSKVALQGSLMTSSTQL